MKIPDGCVECGDTIAARLGDGCPVCAKHLKAYNEGARIACRHTALLEAGMLPGGESHAR